ncbi:MAG: DUF2946 family protein [Candidatus Binatia bacterium]
MFRLARCIATRGVAAAIALLLQGVALPTLHAQHGAAARAPLLCAHHDEAAHLHQPDADETAPHDAAACAVCATLAHGQAGVLAAPTVALRQFTQVWRPLPHTTRSVAAPVRGPGAPRGPPTRSS